MRKNQGDSIYSSVKNHTMFKNPGTLRRLAVIRTPVNYLNLKPMLKKKSHGVKIKRK